MYRSTSYPTSTTRSTTRTSLVLVSSTTLISRPRLVTLRLLMSTLRAVSPLTARLVVLHWRTLEPHSWLDPLSLVLLT